MSMDQGIPLVAMGSRSEREKVNAVLCMRATTVVDSGSNSNPVKKNCFNNECV